MQMLGFRWRRANYSLVPLALQGWSNASRLAFSGGQENPVKTLEQRKTLV